MRIPLKTAVVLLVLLLSGAEESGLCQNLSAMHLRTGPQSAAGTAAQTTVEGTGDSSPAVTIHNDSEPLPDIPALMSQVEQNQRRAEAIEKTYLYRSVETQQEFGSHGDVKKTNVIEADHFWLNGVPVRRIVRRNGKDLTAEELAKENDRIEKEAHRDSERREKNEAQGKESDPQGHEEITVSRLLGLGAFTNPRRVTFNGRSTIVVDYTGDPHAKTRNRGEDAIRDMAGTAWVDEADKVLVRVEGHFVNAFKIGAGLVADIKKDTRFEFQQTKVNSEVWLPARIKAQGAARAMLFFSFSGKIEVIDSDYRKFRATATILPGVERVPKSAEGSQIPVPATR